MGEGQLAVLLHRAEAEVLAAEEEQRVEEDDGGVRPQLFTVPQILLLHPGVDVTCTERDGGRGDLLEIWSEIIRDKRHNDSPLDVMEGLKRFRMLVNITENLL